MKWKPVHSAPGSSSNNPPSRTDGRVSRHTPSASSAQTIHMGDGATAEPSPATAHSSIMGIFLFLLLAGPFFSSVMFGQSLNTSLVGNPDTTGLSASEIEGLERSVKLSLNISGASSDTLIVELGLESGSYDLLTRRFPLSQTGTFTDGCSLGTSGSGLVVGLGHYTGISTFFVRAYLASAGMGSAILVDNE